MEANTLAAGNSEHHSTSYLCALRLGATVGVRVYFPIQETMAQRIEWRQKAFSHKMELKFN